MTLRLSTSPELCITLDPVRVEDHVPSIAFDVTALLVMPFQQTRLFIKERWFSHASLNKFEAELVELISMSEGFARLRDLSDRDVLVIERRQNTISTRVYSTDTTGMTSSMIEVNGYSSEIEELWSALHSYEKWW